MNNLELHIKSFNDREEMGRQAARDIADKLKEVITKKGQARVIFASAPSQDEMLNHLAQEDVDWSKVIGFHMDEYRGLDGEDERLFGSYIKNHLFNKVTIGKYYLMNPSNDEEVEIKRYCALLQESPIDICCMGIGENGHLAFNEPEYADFNDPCVMKPVTLDPICRQQQVNDGCFETIDLVPTKALTLTIPTLFASEFIFCAVPGVTKRDILIKTFSADVNEKIPATILKKHNNCTIYTDQNVIGRE